MKSTLHQMQSIARQRYFEVTRRFFHANAVFKKRFFSCAVKGHVDLDPAFVFDEARARPRGEKAPDGKYYSASYELKWQDFPIQIKDTIRNYDTVIRMFLGDDYHVNVANVWRNMSIPEEYRKSELFSQYWHYDKVVDFRNIQLFVLLQDVSEDDGPFEYIAEPDEYNLMASVLRRDNSDFSAKKSKLTGKRGDTLLFSTGSTPHRAGVPAPGRHRDIFSVAFFPAYTKIGTSSKLLLSQD